jgi:hypothetical protein
MPLNTTKPYKFLKLLPIIFLGFAFSFAKAQFYNLPNDYFFSLLTEKKLAQKDSLIHAGIKPYIHLFSNKYEHVEDNHRIFKYIVEDPALDFFFFKDAIRIEPKKEKFKIRLDPILNLELGKDFSDKRKLYNNTRGFIGSAHIGDKVYVETMFAETQSFFPTYLSTMITADKVVPGQGRWKRFKSSGFDYAFSSGFVSIQACKNFNIQVGHGKQKIGNGYRSLLLSDNSFNYPYARFTQQWFKGRIQYNNIYAVLMNLTSAAKIPNPNAEILYQKKAASFQYASINATRFLNIGLFQGMIWQAGDDKNKQHLNFNYFNPLIYTNLINYALNNKNNILIGTDFKLKIMHTLNIYGQLMADNLHDTSKVGNGWGYQAGINYFDAFGLKNLFLQMEFNNVNESSYKNPANALTDQAYSHYNQTLAYTPGSGRELIFIADYKWKRFFINFKYNYQNKTLNGDNYYFTNITNAKLGYVINPAYNLNIAVGINARSQNFYNFKALNNETNYIYIGFKTSLYNMYYDF